MSGCMGYYNTTVDVYTSSLEKQAGVLAWKLSNVGGNKINFSYVKNLYLFKFTLYFEYFYCYSCSIALLNTRLH